jgi:hypothetical protein
MCGDAINVWAVGDAIAKCDLGIAFEGVGKCDSEALLQAVRFWDVGDAIAFAVASRRELARPRNRY